MSNMKEIQSYKELKNISMSESVILTVSVVEIIERPLYFRIIGALEITSIDSNYVAIDIKKNDWFSDKDWISFRTLAPLDGVKVVVKRSIKDFMSFTLRSIVHISKMETPHYVQYCDKCDEFEFVENIDAFKQCCADDPKHPADRQISKVPMKLRANLRVYHGDDPILYPIRPIGLYEEFLPDQVHRDTNFNHIQCPACGKCHDVYTLRSRRTREYFKYCPVANKITQIDPTEKSIKEETNMNRINISETNLQSVKKEEPMDFTGHMQIPVNGMFGSKDEDDPANDYAVCPKHALETAQKAIDEAKKYNDSVGSLSDGYHTFDELYHHRALLFASLCLTGFKEKAWKSLLHSDSKNNPMYPGMFIVGVETPFGQATYHYDIDPYWSIFKVKELDHAPEYDGHTPKEAIDRIYKYALKLGSTVNRSFSDGLVTIPCGTTTTRNINTTGNPVLDGDATISCEDRPVV